MLSKIKSYTLEGLAGSAISCTESAASAHNDSL